MVKHKLLIESPEMELQWDLKILGGEVCLMCYTNKYPSQKFHVLQITKDGQLHRSSSVPDSIGLQVDNNGKIKEID